MAAAAAAAVLEKAFSEEELEVAAILLDLPALVRRAAAVSTPDIAAGAGRTWGRTRPRSRTLAAEKPPGGWVELLRAAAPVADGGGEVEVAVPVTPVPAGSPAADGGGEKQQAASPVTPLDSPLVFPDTALLENWELEEQEAAAAAKKRPKNAPAREEAQRFEEQLEQRASVAGLPQENTAAKVRDFSSMQSSRGASDDGSKQQQQQTQTQSKAEQRRQRRQREEEEEEEESARKRQATAPRPALGLDLNEPPPEEEAGAEWYQYEHQHQHHDHLAQQRAAAAAEARRRRRDILRAKAPAAARAVRTR